MAELYTRWLQFGVFNPLSRAHHEGDNAAEPWLFGAEAEKNCRAAIELKYQLFPYIYTYAREAHDKGLPLMRALLLEYPNDPQTFSVDDQFFFGKELLVAPVVKKGAQSRKVYLPEGEWIDFNDGKTMYEGEQTISYKTPLSRIPIFVKKGSIIPMMPVMQYVHERRDYPLTLQIYPAAEGQQTSFTLYEDDGETNNYLENVSSSVKFSFQTLENKYVFNAEARKNNGYTAPGKRDYVLKIYLPSKPGKISIAGKLVSPQSFTVFNSTAGKVLQKTGWAWDEKNGICYVRLPEDGKEKQVEISR